MEIFSLVGSILLKDDNTKGKLQEIDASASKLGGTFDSAFSKIASTALKVGGIIGAGLGFKAMFSAAEASQQKLAQMDSVLKSTGDASGMTKAQLLELADSQGKLTEYSKGTNIASENLLLTFTNIGSKVFPDALKAVNDMSQALGQDTSSSAIQLGKALNNPITGITSLSRVGVTFTAQQKEQIKAMVAAGNTAGAQSIILKELQKEFGGSAEAAGKTFGGQLTILKNQIAGVGASIASTLMPGLTSFMEKVNDNMPKIQSVVTGAINTAKPYISDIVKDVGQIASNLLPDLGSSTNSVGSIISGVVKGGFTAFKDVLDWIAQHGTITKAALISIASGFVSLKIISTIAKSLLDFRNGMNLVEGATGIVSRFGTAFMELGTAPTILTGIKGAFTAISGIKVPKIAFTGMFTGLTTGLSSAGSAISKFIFGPWALLGNGLKSLPNTIKNLNFASVIAKITAPFKSIPALITGAFSKIPSLLGVFKGAFTSFGTTIIALGPKILAGIRSMFSIQGIMTGAKTALSLFTNPWAVLILAIVAGVGAIIANWSKISAFAQKIFGGDTTQILTTFKTFFIQVWEDIKADVTAVWNYIGPTITGAVTQIQSFWNQVWPEVKQVFVEVWDLMKVVIAPIMAIMYTAISTGIGVIKGIWGPAWNAIKDTLKTVWDAMSGVIKVAWDIISGVIKVGLDLATGHWSKAWGDFKNIFSNVWSDLKSSISNIAKDALQWGKDIIQGIINGIKGGISGLEDAVSNVGKTIWSYLHHSTPEEGLLADDDTWMPDFMQGLADGITNNTSIVTDALEKLTKKMKSKAQVKAPTVNVTPTPTVDNSKQNLDASLSSGLSNSNQAVSSVNTISSKISSTMTTLASKFTQNGQQLNINLGKAITDTQDKVTKPVDELSNTITDKVSDLVQKFLTYGQNTDTNLGNGITANASATTTPLTTLITTLTNAILAFIQNCIQYGQNVDINLGSGITNNSTVVVTAIGNILTTLTTNIQTFIQACIQFGESISTNLATGITNTVQKVTDAVTQITDKISNLLKAFAISCTSIGQSIGSSIGDGIRSSEDNVVSIAHELTQKIIQAFTGPDGFDIHSPSRKLFEIGAYVIQGFVNGLSSLDVVKFFQNKILSVLGAAGDVSKWLAVALMLTGTPMDWLPGLLKLTSYESGDPGTIGSGSATLVNGIAVGNEYATGLLQMLPSTFAENMLSGFGDIMNPIDNAISAIRYIKNRYGSVYNTPLFTSGGVYNGYATGTDDATEGGHEIAENGFEIVLGRALRWFKGGETVLNHSDSLKFLDNIRNTIDTIKALRDMSFTSFLPSTESKTENTNANTKNITINQYNTVNSQEPLSPSKLARENKRKLKELAFLLK